MYLNGCYGFVVVNSPASASAFVIDAGDVPLYFFSRYPLLFKVAKSTDSPGFSSCKKYICAASITNSCCCAAVSVLALETTFPTNGIEIATINPKIAITASNSTNVNPPSFFNNCLILFLMFISSVLFCIFNCLFTKKTHPVFQQKFISFLLYKN